MVSKASSFWHRARVRVAGGVCSQANETVQVFDEQSLKLWLRSNMVKTKSNLRLIFLGEENATPCGVFIESNDPKLLSLSLRKGYDFLLLAQHQGTSSRE